MEAGGRLQAWDLERERVTASIHAHDWSTFDCAPLGEQRVVTASEDQTLRVWDVQTGWSRLLYGHEVELDRCAALGDGRIVSLDEDGMLRVWDAETGRCHAVFPTGVEACSMAVREQVVALGAESGELVVLEIGAPEPA